jgi:hypothetical protein
MMPRQPAISTATQHALPVAAPMTSEGYQENNNDSNGAAMNVPENTEAQAKV